ncbi:hypothetical protein OCU04_009678 [Sclerotinia nivalis]|uniref:Uncharacterized protein n=1 Tax=Sclerotinia nivalis TaxID=352851 RepID=A0A9X0AFJ8_9HELO|nr:hypothetical protein OCU04_009678 [Sclerotinia nivalis]
MPSLVDLFLSNAWAGLRVRTRPWCGLLPLLPWFAERAFGVRVGRGLRGRGRGRGRVEDDKWWVNFEAGHIEGDQILVLGCGCGCGGGGDLRNIIGIRWDHNCCG